jgi:hypothetical protein
VDALQLITSIVGGAFGVGAAWTALRAGITSISKTVAAQEITLGEHGRKFYEQLQKIADQNTLIERLTARVMVLEHDANEGANRAVEERRVTQKTLAWQNQMLMEIHAGRTGPRRTDSREFKSTDRTETDSDAPKPYRPRLPTLRGKDE